MALNLVDYSDSDSRSDSEQNPPKRLRTTKCSTGPAPDLPPLPPRFHDLYATAPRLAGFDDPSLHRGRQRATPHEVGSWPTFVFLEWHLDAAEFSILNQIIHRCQTIIAQYERQRLGIVEDSPDNKTVSSPDRQDGKRKARHCARDESLVKSPLKLVSSLVGELGAEQPLHVSLSRPNHLKTEEKAGFVDLLEERISKARIKPFDISFTGFEWVSNFDGTRWFFVMKANSKDNELRTLLRLTNSTFATYRQPALYCEHKGDSGFHVTIGSSLEAPEKELISQLQTDIGNEFKTQLSQLSMKAQEVKIKIGNVIKVLPLKT